MPTDEERRQLKAAYKERERARAREQIVLGEDQLNALLDHLDEKASLSCDHSLRHTREWALANGVDVAALTVSLAELGSYCDCEVLANVDPDEPFQTPRRRPVART
jgi:hypothetical protein